MLLLALRKDKQITKDLMAWNQALKEGFEAGVESEQERIIKLLEEHTITAKYNLTPVGNSGWFERGMEYAIALIKGETND